MNLAILPKAEIHCHLDGIPSPAMVRDIVRHDPAYPLQPDEFEQAYPVTDLESFFRWFSFLHPIDDELDYFYPVLERYVAQSKAQNVRYSEIMIASSELPRDPVEAVEKVGAFREWATRQEAGQIQVEFLIATGRNKSPEAMERLVPVFLALYEAGLIVGVALAGIERGNPVKPFRRTFAQLHEAGIGIEIHAGEWCGPESVWDALENGYPDRIGHGVSIFQDARLLDLVRERQIHIEMCPTSNVKTASVSTIESHPIRQARDLGLNFSVNTDDPGPFECSMLSEYELLAGVFGFGEEDFRRLYANALAARFQPVLRNRVSDERSD